MDSGRLAEVLPLLPFPPWTLIVLMGDVPALLLLAALAYRCHRLSWSSKQQGDLRRKSLYERKARIYVNFIIGSVAVTVVCFGVFVLAVLTLPGSVAASPVGLTVGYMAWLPFVVWLSPIAAVLADLVMTGRR